MAPCLKSPAGGKKIRGDKMGKPTNPAKGASKNQLRRKRERKGEQSRSKKEKGGSRGINPRGTIMFYEFFLFSLESA